MAYTKRVCQKAKDSKMNIHPIELVILMHKPFSKNEKRISGFGFEQLQSIGKSMVKYTISRQSAYCSLAQMEVTFEDPSWRFNIPSSPTLQWLNLARESLGNSDQKVDLEWELSCEWFMLFVFEWKKWFHLLQKHEKFLTEMEKKWIGVTATGPKKNSEEYDKLHSCILLQNATDIYIIYPIKEPKKNPGCLKIPLDERIHASRLFSGSVKTPCCGKEETHGQNEPQLPRWWDSTWDGLNTTIQQTCFLYRVKNQKLKSGVGKRAPEYISTTPKKRFCQTITSPISSKHQKKHWKIHRIRWES